MKMMGMTISNLNSLLNDERKAKSELMNRLQAGDLKTLMALETPVVPVTTYHSAHDTKELETLSQGQGLGYEIYDDGTRDSDEFLAAVDELGISFEK